jgi:CubicO group peptidase (beta-lactamase class C family)
MKKLSFILPLVVLAFLNCSHSSDIDPVTPQTPVTGDSEITNRIKTIVESRGLPAISAAIIRNGDGNRVGAAGVRRKGGDSPVQVNDLWHIGAGTQAFTATLAAKLVERGLLRWDSTTAEVFPELAAGFHDDCKAINLQQLLSHFSGLRYKLDWLGQFTEGDPVEQQRLQAVRLGLSEKPQLTPGSQWQFSQLGYVIAGAMIERVLGCSWEQAIRTEIFLPLLMNDSGFGIIGTGQRLDQPWGHDELGNPISPEASSNDLPPVVGPAAGIFCPLSDWAKFIADHIKGGRGGNGLLLAESYRKLHTPPYGGVDAMGWSRHPGTSAGEYYLAFDGEGRGYYALVFVYPFANQADFVCLNQGGNPALNAAHEVLSALGQITGSSALEK